MYYYVNRWKMWAFGLEVGLMFAVIIIFLISSKLHSLQINRPKKLATHLYTFIHLFISHKGEKSWTFLESMERKVTNKLNSCKFYQMQEAIFLKWI